MPSTSLKMDIKPPIDPLEPYKNFGLVFEKKLRNFEKRKVKLDGYKDQLSSGSTLNEDQTDAIKRYDTVIQSMDVIKELQKLYASTIIESEKYQKKYVKRTKLQKNNTAYEKFQEYLKLEFVISQFGEEIIRDDFRDEKNGAVLIENKDLEALDVFAELVQSNEELSYKERIHAQSEVMLNYCESREVSISPESSFTFTELNVLINHILSNDYFENISLQKEVEQSEELKEDIEHTMEDEFINEDNDNNEDKPSSETFEEFEVIQHEDINKAVQEDSEYNANIQESIHIDTETEYIDSKPEYFDEQPEYFDEKLPNVEIIQTKLKQSNVEDKQPTFDSNQHPKGGVEKSSNSEQLYVKTSTYSGKVMNESEKSKNKGRSQKVTKNHLRHLEIEDDEFLKLKQQPENPRTFSEIVTSVKGIFNFSQDSEVANGMSKVEFRQTAAERHHQPSTYQPKLSPPQQHALYDREVKIEPIHMRQEDQIYQRKNNINQHSEVRSPPLMFPENDRLTPPQHMQHHPPPMHQTMQQQQQQQQQQQPYHPNHQIPSQTSRINQNQHHPQQQTFQPPHQSQPPHITQAPHATQPPHVSQPSQPLHVSQPSHDSQPPHGNLQPHVSHPSQPPQVTIPSQQTHLPHHKPSHSPLTTQSPLPQPPPPPHLTQHLQHQDAMQQINPPQSHYPNLPPHSMHPPSTTLDHDKQSPPNQATEPMITEPNQCSSSNETQQQQQQQQHSRPPPPSPSSQQYHQQRGAHQSGPPHRGQGDGRYRNSNNYNHENSRENYQRSMQYGYNRESQHHGNSDERNDSYRNDSHRSEIRNDGGRPMRGDGMGPPRGMRGNSNSYSRGRGGGRGNYDSQRYINRGQNPNQYNRKGDATN